MVLTGSFQQLSLEFEIKSRGESAELVISSRSQVWIGRPQVQECHVEESARHICWTYLLMNGDGILWQNNETLRLEIASKTVLLV